METNQLKTQQTNKRNPATKVPEPPQATFFYLNEQINFKDDLFPLHKHK